MCTTAFFGHPLALPGGVALIHVHRLPDSLSAGVRLTSTAEAHDWSAGGHSSQHDESSDVSPVPDGRRAQRSVDSLALTPHDWIWSGGKTGCSPTQAAAGAARSMTRHAVRVKQDRPGEKGSLTLPSAQAALGWDASEHQTGGDGDRP